MVEIKLKPGMKFKYKGIDFICLDIINGNCLAITAECWCIKRFNEKIRGRLQQLGKNPLSAAFLTKMCSMILKTHRPRKSSLLSQASGSDRRLMTLRGNVWKAGHR